MIKSIEQYNLVDFVKAIHDAVHDGWEIDFDDNEQIPHGGLGFYRCKMHKGKQVAALFLPPEPVPEKSPEPDLFVAQPFVPSVVFEVKEQPAQETKKVGRPKGHSI